MNDFTSLTLDLLLVSMKPITLSEGGWMTERMMHRPPFIDALENISLHGMRFAGRAADSVHPFKRCTRIHMVEQSYAMLQQE